MSTLKAESFLQLVEQKNSEIHASTGLTENKHQIVNYLWRPQGKELRAASNRWKQLLAKNCEENKDLRPTATRKWLLPTTSEHPKL